MLEFLANPLQQVPIPRISVEIESNIATAVEELHSIDVMSSRWTLDVKIVKDTIDQALFKALSLSLAQQRQMYKFVQQFTN